VHIVFSAPLQLIEKLYRERWNKFDGLGGLVITPTRELALQIFQQLRRVGARQEFSAGLLIGGNNVKEEQARVNGARKGSVHDTAAETTLTADNALCQQLCLYRAKQCT
jgi:superfamily II DNA/RNA helicase